MTARRLWPHLAVLFGLIAVGVALRFTVFAPTPVPVRTVAAEKGRVEETVTNSRAGTVKARRRAKLAPETGGRVLLLPHRRGSRVRAGDVLLRVEDSLQRAQLRLAGDESKAALAQRDHESQVFHIDRIGFEQIGLPRDGLGIVRLGFYRCAEWSLRQGMPVLH